MQFNDLLQEVKISPKDVMVFRHRPKEPKLRKVLPWLVNENHKVFNAYQQTQGPIVEKSMLRAKYVASFIGHEAGKALFVGLYEVNDHWSLSFEQYWKEPTLHELKTKYEMRGMTDKSATSLWFDLVILPFHEEWKGKLIICWPGKELSWWRWADRNEFAIHAITEDSLLDRKMEKWDELVLSWNELEVIPKKWCEELSRWKGIYYILDTSDGKGYVGAAYGEDNIYGRWRDYGRTGHGGNKELRNRKPENFLFSILQIVAHDMESDNVQSLETKWKKRLHTRDFGLNDN
jgi:hypothetical protein